LQHFIKLLHDLQTELDRARFGRIVSTTARLVKLVDHKKDANHCHNGGDAF